MLGSNGVGVAFLPIFVGVEGKIQNAELLIDGVPTPHAELDIEQVDLGSPGNPNVQWTYGLRFYHDFLPNGPVDMQVRTTIVFSDIAYANVPAVTVTAPVMPTTVDNSVSFDNWHPMISGISHTFEATTEIYPATWQIDIYDVVQDLVQTTSGSTSDGNISWTWDLRDTSGALRDDIEYDPFFDPYITVTPTGGGAQAAGQGEPIPAPITVLDFPKVGAWLFGITDIFDHEPQHVQTAMWDLGIETLPGGPILKNIPTYVSYLKYGTNYTQAQRDLSWHEFRTGLGQKTFSNLYYFGHGTPWIIGGDEDHFDADGNVLGSFINDTNGLAHIRIDQMGSLVSRNKLLGPKRFRFVFLDGCSTATTWPDVFEPFDSGIATNSLAYCHNTGRRPTTFAGWNDTISYTFVQGVRTPTGFGDYQQFADFRTFWMSWWSVENSQLPQAFQIAQQQSNWISQALMNQVLRVYGYRTLRFLEFNERDAWPPN